MMAGGVAVVLAASAVHAVLVRSGAACPVLSPSSADLVAQRIKAMGDLRGVVRALSTDAFGFALGVTSRASFVSAREGLGDQCESELEGALVRCEGSEGELVARFNPGGSLVGADRMLYVEGLESGAALFDRLAAADTARFGAPERSWGDTSAAYLGEPLRQVGVAYRFVDVAVDLSATRMGADKFAVREQVRSIPRVTGRGG